MAQLSKGCDQLLNMDALPVMRLDPVAIQYTHAGFGDSGRYSAHVP